MFSSAIRWTAFAFIVAVSVPALTSAATITSGAVRSSVSAPSGILGGSASNGVSLTVSPTLLKLVGDIDLTTVDGGSTRDNTLILEGEVSLEQGDAFSLAYDYDVFLTGGGTVNLTTTAITNFDGVINTLTNTETVDTLNPVDEPFSFTFAQLGFEASTAVTGTWTGEFRFDWIDAPADSSLKISIPNNSIDFAVVDASAIPEPASGSVLLLAAISGLTFRRRIGARRC